MLIPILLSSTCKSDSEKVEEVRFEIKTFHQSLGECDTPDGLCALIDLVYPFAVGGNESVRNAINQRIICDLVDSFTFEKCEGEMSEKQMELLANNFLEEWRWEAEQKNEAFPFGWEVSVTGEVGLQTPKIVVLSLSAYSYTGGAHPNSYVLSHNFDLRDGGEIHWNDIATDTTALKKLAENYFKEARELPLEADLIEEGYFWGESFALPQNFEIQEDGIYFWYNAYEAAPYALGPTAFLVSYQELGDLVRRDKIF